MPLGRVSDRTAGGRHVSLRGEPGPDGVPGLRVTRASALPRPLGLHHHTVNELAPLDFVEVAAACGYDTVSLFTNVPRVPHAGRESMFRFPVVTPELKRDVIRRLDERGLKVVGAEFFLLTPDADLEAYVPGLALGRELGAIHAMSHVFETDRSRAVDLLGRFSELAHREGLKVCIEFCQLTPGCRTIYEAVWLIDQVGGSNTGINVCPMHLIRSGGTAEDVARLRDRYIINAQINDGHGTHVSSSYFDEVHNRELPGDGDFPLHAILSALRRDTPVEVKIPCDRRKAAGVSALEYAREAGRRARGICEALEHGAAGQADG